MLLPICRLTAAIYLLPFLFLAACGMLEPSARLNQTQNAIDFKLPLPLPPTVDAVKFASCMAPQTAKLQLGFSRFVDKLDSHSGGKLLLAEIGLLDDSPVIDSVLNVRSEVQALIARLRYAIEIKDTDRTKSMSDPAVDNIADTQQLSIDIERDMKLLDDLTRTYLKAYFTKPLSLKPSGEDKTKLRADMAAILKRNPQDQKISRLLELLEPQLKSSTNAGAGFGGFIDRDGSQFGFPGVTTANSSLKVNYSQIATDVMRIFLDALRDGLSPLPVLKNSTAASRQHDFDILQFESPEQPITLEWHMDRQDASKILNISISPQQFENIEAKARQAEASVASKTGKAVRGGSMGSLNNEAVAQLMETAAGVLARHTSERAQWCLLAQNKL